MRRRGRSQKGPDPRRRTTLFLFFLQHNHCVADHSRPQSGDGADNATDHRIDPTAGEEHLPSSTAEKAGQSADGKPEEHKTGVKQTDRFLIGGIPVLIVPGKPFLQIGGFSAFAPIRQFFLCAFEGLLLGKPLFHQILHVIAHVEHQIVLGLRDVSERLFNFASFAAILVFVWPVFRRSFSK